MSLGFGMVLASLKVKREEREKCLQLVFESMFSFQPLCFYRQFLLVDPGCLAQQSCTGTAFHSHLCALEDAPLSLPGAYLCSVHRVFRQG